MTDKSVESQTQLALWAILAITLGPLIPYAL